MALRQSPRMLSFGPCGDGWRLAWLFQSLSRSKNFGRARSVSFESVSCRAKRKIARVWWRPHVRAHQTRSEKDRGFAVVALLDRRRTANQRSAKGMRAGPSLSDKADARRSRRSEPRAARDVRASHRRSHSDPAKVRALS